MDAPRVAPARPTIRTRLVAFAAEETQAVSERWVIAWLGVFLVVGAFLRLYKLGADSLWLDEIDTVTTAAFPLRQMFRAIAWHVSPPLDYIVLHSVLPLGRDETLVRLPAALFGILAIYLLYRAGRELLDVGVGLGAAALLAFSMAAIVYAREARMYSLFLCLTVCILWASARLIRKPVSRKRWAVAGAAALLALYTHYYAILVLAGLGLLWLAGCFWRGWNRELFARGGATFSAIGLLFAPWLPIMRQQFAASGGALGHALPRQDYWWIVRHFVSGGASMRFAWLFFFLFAVGLLYCVWKKPVVAGLLVAFTVLPALLAYYVPLISASVTPRNMIFLLPGYLTGVATGFSALAQLALALWQKRGRATRHSLLTPWLTVAGVTILALWSSASMIFPFYHADWWMRGPRTEWRQTAQFLQQSMRPGDLILVDHPRSRYLLSFYLDPLAIEGVTLNDFNYNPDSATSGVLRYVPIVSQDAPPEALAAAIADARTVWIVYPEQISAEAITLDADQWVAVDSPYNIPLASFAATTPEE
jgi:uncharacterized membrane protein